MISLIAGIVLPIVWLLISALMLDNASGKKSGGKNVNKNGGGELFYKFSKIMFIEAVLFTLLNIIAIYRMFDGRGIPLTIEFFVSVVPFAGIFAASKYKNEKLSLFLKKVTVCLFAILAAEILIFNAKSFSSYDRKVKMDLSGFVSDSAEMSPDGKLIVSKDTVLKINTLPESARAVILDMERLDENNKPVLVTLSVTDDNHSGTADAASKRYTMAAGKKLDLPFFPYGKTRALTLTFSEVNSSFAINSMYCMSAIPYGFSAVRFFVVLAIAVLIAAVFDLKLYKVTFQRKKRLHIVLVEGMVLLCTAMSLIFVNFDGKPAEYKDGRVDPYDIFAMTFDAFQKKQVSLDIEPDPMLGQLENVYDRSEREASGASYFWDYAYYEGKYYCYFGAAPVIAFYYPYYLINHKIPPRSTAQGFFAVLAVYFACRTLLAAIKIFVPRPNLLLLLMLMPALISCSGIFNMANEAYMYYLPMTAGLCFLFLSLWLGFEAYTAKNKYHRMTLLFISGLSLGFCAGSRPGMALCSVVLIPLFLGIIRNKKQSVGFRAAQAASFLVPLCACGVVIMLYNSARFGSPLEFGASYQLTVSDIRANKLSLRSIFPMIYHYFFQLPEMSTTFPFFEPEFFDLKNYGKYTFTEPTVGAFSYPIVIFGMLMIPAAFQRNGRSFCGGVSKLQRRSMLILSCSAVVVTGWWNFCLGGTSIRYVVDLMPLLMIISLVCVLRAVGDPEKNALRYSAAAGCAAATFVIGMLLQFVPKNGNVMHSYPTLYETLEDLMIFWK